MAFLTLRFGNASLEKVCSDDVPAVGRYERRSCSASSKCQGEDEMWLDVGEHLMYFVL